MKNTMLTLIVVLSLVLSTQVIAFYIQYKVNKTYKGIGHWLLGSSLMALGLILMPIVARVNLKFIEIFTSSLILLGYIFLHVGIKWFLNEPLKKWIHSSVLISFILLYSYYTYINNSIPARTVVISTAFAIVSFMMAYDLYLKKEKYLYSTANFMAKIFFICGSLNLVRVFYTMITPPVGAHTEEGYIIIVIIIIDIIISNLWTLGLIIMVNQRLNIDNQLKREQLQIIFNTSIDAQLITRLEDGFIVNVNDEFTVLSGYSKDEVIGSYTNRNILWNNAEDRHVFADEINSKGLCKNMEFVFKRKDKSKFTGMVSARVINIHSIKHIISVIRDVTLRKKTELKMKKLVEQLEIEKNTAQLNAITDSLSGLYNRGYFDNTLRAEFARLTRSGSTLSLIMLDIDHFKKFNDSYGHLAGDKCIQKISASLKASVERASDVVARYGGEEFIVILPETDEEGAKILAERIRIAIEDLAIPHISSQTAKHVTVSVGVTTVYPAKLVSPEEAVKLVDEALYSAKDKGRNRCVYQTKGKKQ